MAARDCSTAPLSASASETLLTDAGHDVVGLDTGLYADCTLGPAPAPVPALRVDLRDVRAEHLDTLRERACRALAAVEDRQHVARFEP